MGSKVGADVGSDVGCLEGIVIGGAEGVGTLGRLTSPLCGGQMRESSRRLGEVATRSVGGDGGSGTRTWKPPRISGTRASAQTEAVGLGGNWAVGRIYGQDGANWRQVRRSGVATRQMPATIKWEGVVGRLLSQIQERNRLGQVGFRVEARILAGNCPVNKQAMTSSGGAWQTDFLDKSETALGVVSWKAEGPWSNPASSGSGGVGQSDQGQESPRLSPSAMPAQTKANGMEMQGVNAVKENANHSARKILVNEKLIGSGCIYLL